MCLPAIVGRQDKFLHSNVDYVIMHRDNLHLKYQLHPDYYKIDLLLEILFHRNDPRIQFIHMYELPFSHQQISLRFIRMEYIRFTE